MLKTEKINEELKNKFKNIALLLPTYKIIGTPAYHSMMVLIARLYREGFNPSIFLLDQTNVSIARNTLVKYFLENHNNKNIGPYDVAMWIDSDQTFEYQDFINLLFHYSQLNEAENVDILSGKYITRDLNQPKVCAFMKDECNVGYKAVLPDTTGVVEVDGFGFGFVMMNPEVMQKMYDEYGLHQFCFRTVGDKNIGSVLGEDLDWCDKAQKLGYKLYFDSDISIGHHGLVADERLLALVGGRRR